MESDLCDGTDSSVIQNTQCTFAMSDLKLDPFNLILGYSIQFKV